MRGADSVQAYKKKTRRKNNEISKVKLNKESNNKTLATQF